MIRFSVLLAVAVFFLGASTPACETLPKDIEQEISTDIDAKRYDEALEGLAVMERFAPVVDMAWVHTERGFIFLQQLEFQEAVDELTKAIALNEKRGKEKAAPYYNRGWAYLGLSKIQEAEQDLTRAIALEPNKAFRYQERAIFYGRIRRFDEALKDIGQAIDLDPSSPVNYVLRADYYFAQRRAAEGIADLRKVLELQGEGPDRDAAIRRLKLLGLEP